MLDAAFDAQPVTCGVPHSLAARYVVYSQKTGGPRDSEAVAMIYDENNEPEQIISGEIVWIWIFAISIVGSILFALNLVE